MGNSFLIEISEQNSLKFIEIGLGYNYEERHKKYCRTSSIFYSMNLFFYSQTTLAAANTCNKVRLLSLNFNFTEIPLSSFDKCHTVEIALCVFAGHIDTKFEKINSQIYRLKATTHNKKRGGRFVNGTFSTNL